MMNTIEAEQPPIAWLYQHGETGRQRIVMPDQVFTNADGQWLLVSPLYIAAADYRQALRQALDAMRRSDPVWCDLMDVPPVTDAEWDRCLATLENIVDGNG
jgi:hypothetical protein